MILISATAQGQTDISSSSAAQWLMEGSQGYQVLPPIRVCKGELKFAKWSPGGKYLLVYSRSDPFASTMSTSEVDEVLTTGLSLIEPWRNHIYIWSRATMKSTEVWTGGIGESVEKIRWFHSGKAALLWIHTSSFNANPNSKGKSTAVVLMNAATGQTRFLIRHIQKSATTVSSIAVSPLNDEVLISESVYRTSKGSDAVTVLHTFTELYNSKGDLISTFPDVPVFGYDWSPDGTEIFGTDYQYSTMTRKYSPVYYLFSRNGTYDKLQQKPAFYKKPPAPHKNIHLVVEESSVRVGNRFEDSPEVILASKIKSLKPACLLRGIVQRPILAPDLSAVGYESNGSYFVRRIIAIQPAALRAMLEAERAKAITNAQEVADGMIMYSVDNSDNLPSGNWQTLVYPYVKDQALIDNFTYVQPSILNLHQIQNQATTQIGSVAGPGGNAIAYADGHVVWQPNP